MLLAFITYAGLPELSSDDQLAVKELGRRGVGVTPVAWSDPDVRWAEFDAAVLRSTWDYHRRPAEFRLWLGAVERAGVRLWNPAPLARWNMNKRYLRDLEARGVAIVPTEWIARGASVDLAPLLHDRGWLEAVVKPTISATAFETMRVDRTTVAMAQTHAEQLLRAGDMMVQPFMREIAAGEWSLVFFHSELSHAVLKRPATGDFRVQAEFGGNEQRASPPPHMIATARSILRTLDAPWLYARVDGIDTANGFLLSELELLEPTLFLSLDQEAPKRFANAICAVAG